MQAARRWLAFAARAGAGALVAALLLAAGPAFAEKSYARDDLASDAVRLEAGLRQQAGQVTNLNVDAAKRDARAALARGDARAALNMAAKAVAAAPADATAWLLYARASLAVKTNSYSELYKLRGQGSVAAYAAYQKASDKAVEAAALAVLGEAFAEREIWRPALDAYAASLALADNADVRSTYETLRNEHGFRITDYKVDSDSATPRVCFEFSEALARGKVDFAPYVVLSGASGAAVTTEDRQLCVDGLKHGERYSVVLRQGLPSAVQETLLRNADYEIYVRDRSPRVRFTGRNYVLPRTGQEGIPIVSVNTDAVRIDLARIGDRSLLPTVRSDDFLAQLNRYGIDQILDEKGYRVWTGDLAVKSELNKDVVTAFPVMEAVKGRLEPGIYVMTARPANGAADTSGDDYDQRATQWFVVSDYGLTAISGEGGLTVLLRSLASAQPLSGVELRLVARNNEVLASRTTDSTGAVTFEPGLARGTGGLAPGLVVASGKDGDYAFLDLVQTAFDLSDRGVDGRAAPGPLDAFLYTERGVYRSGETVYLTALLRDAKGVAVPGLPLTLAVKRPDGVEFRRAMVEDQGEGGRAFSIPLISGAQTGTWRVQAFADPKGRPVGEATFLVEDYVPERLEVNLKPLAEALHPGEPATIEVEARYLFGAPGAGLDVAGEVVVAAADGSGVAGLDGYAVGIDDEEVEAVTAEIEQHGTTDAGGRARIEVPIPEVTAPRPLKATVTLRVGEEGGRAVSRSVILPILPGAPVIGVKKLFSDLSDGAVASFDVVVAQPDGKRLAKPLQWTLSRVEKRYQWYYNEGRWSYETADSTHRQADGRIEAAVDAPARIAVPVTWGSYRLDVTGGGSDAALTSISFSVGYSGDVAADAPDVLEVKLDREDYRAGDELKLALNSRFAGTATVAILGDKLYESKFVTLPAGESTVSLPVKADWGGGAYAVAFAHRPLDVAAHRMPGRALGVAWFGVDRKARELAVALDPPKAIRPRGELVVPVSVTGAAPGEEVFVTVSAVDVGILNLTGYETPDPTGFYFGQRRLSAEIRDLYGYLIDGMQGTRGAIRSGGDAAPQINGDTPTQEPLARYSGVVKVGPDGKASVSFPIPAFNGTLRVMASAWSKERVGSADTEVLVRDPVVLTGTVPRFLSIGDRSRLFVQIDNVEAPEGDYVVDLDVRGPVVVTADALRRTVRLAKGGETGSKTTIAVPVTAAGQGTARFDVRLFGNGIETVANLAVRVQPGTPATVRRTVRPLPAGGKVTLSADLAADLVPGTGVISVTVSPLAALDVPALLQALDRYPYGCTEQTVSRALPLLYANRLASAEQLAIDPDLDGRIAEAINRVLARQDSNGSFGLWSVGGDDIWLDAFVSDFLTRSRERGFVVPQRAFDLALERLRNSVANTGEVDAERSNALAYAIYVLARNGRPVMGDLRYLADTKLAEFGSPLARAQIGAALAMLGDRGRAQTAFASAVEALSAEKDEGVFRPDFGSRLRDASAVLALAVEAGMARGEVRRTGAILEQARAATHFTSTQEQAWMVLAAQAIEDEAKAMQVNVDGKTGSGPLFRAFRADDLTAPVTIVNAGQDPAQIAIAVAGNPVDPEGPASSGYAVERSYHRLDGSKVDVSQVKQNERLVVVLKVTESQAQAAQLLIVDYLPAGFEIDNPRLVDGAETKAFSWIRQEDIAPLATEFRDDRFVAAYRRQSGQPAFLTLAYTVRAVSPGRYVHPPAVAEDMYRPDRFGRTGFGTVEVVPAKP